ncbi:MAG: ABC transporter permease [Caldanaerobacter subterraneus]|nr:ABC transporter permease [Caldanaerobacter subterraneus]
MKYLWEAELRRFVKFIKNMPTANLPFLIFLYILFWLINFSSTLVIGNVESSRSLTAANMLGYVVWFFAMFSISSIAQNMEDERMQGTFEHLHLSSVDIKSIFLVRALIHAIESIVIIAIFILIVGLIHRVVVFTNIYSLLVLLILLPGLYGFAFFLAGLVLMMRSKEAKNWLAILIYVLLVPLLIPERILSPAVREIFSYFPMFQSVMMLRKLNIERIPLNLMGVDFVKLVITSILFLVIGFLIFDIADKKAKKKGILGTY